MRTVRTSDVNHRHAQRHTLLLFGGIHLALNVQVGSFDVRIDKQRQIGRVYIALEVRLVHLDQVMISLLGVLK